MQRAAAGIQPARVATHTCQLGTGRSSIGLPPGCLYCAAFCSSGRALRAALQPPSCDSRMHSVSWATNSLQLLRVTSASRCLGPRSVGFSSKRLQARAQCQVLMYMA